MKNEEENKLITIALARAGGDMIAADFLERLIERARSYGHQGDYVCVRDFVRWCHKEYDERPPTDEELEPFIEEQEKKNKCKGCGFPIAEGAVLCGECACEDDCRPN